MCLFHLVYVWVYGANNTLCIIVLGVSLDVMCVGGPCIHVQRTWTDFQITSHCIFVVAIPLSLFVRFYELTIMTSAVLFFSVWYHRNREVFGIISSLDSFFAKSFFMYALVQMSRSPSPTVLCLNLLFASVTAACFLATYLKHDAAFYARVHPLGLHVCPGLWTLLVVIFHRPILLEGNLRPFQFPGPW